MELTQTSRAASNNCDFAVEAEDGLEVLQFGLAFCFFGHCDVVDV